MLPRQKSLSVAQKQTKSLSVARFWYQKVPFMLPPLKATKNSFMLPPTKILYVAHWPVPFKCLRRSSRTNSFMFMLLFGPWQTASKPPAAQRVYGIKRHLCRWVPLQMRPFVFILLWTLWFVLRFFFVIRGYDGPKFILFRLLLWILCGISRRRFLWCQDAQTLWCLMSFDKSVEKKQK